MPTDEPNEEDVVPPGEPGPRSDRRLGRTRALGGWLLRRSRSKRGFFVLLILVAGIGSVVTLGGVASMKWTETASFCSSCHTMSPEVKAYERSAHRDVPCAECHVGPGIGGWIKAKANGAKQTLQLIIGSYPKPIPQPDHALLPPVKDTCMRCHSPTDITEDGGPTKLVLRPRYRKDRSNTREMVAVVVRPGGLGKRARTRGPHWHVKQRVEFTSAGERSRRIDWVRVTYRSGRTKQFIAQSKVGVSSNVRPDIERLRRTQTTRRMDCIDCHNRVGHSTPSPDRAIDDAIAAGRISRDLPYVKREGLSRLSASYPSAEAADRAIAGIRRMYAAKYPLVLKTRRRSVSRAIDELKRIYRLVATPEMKVTAKTYGSNLGHRTSAGCFRCHDGAHYQVVKGQVTKRTIPWACTTCHTFPQVGPTVSSVSLLGEPADHKSRLWVFDHKKKVSLLDPAGTTCSACHKRSYCANCHRAGPVKVKHDEMYYSHPTALAKSGRRACAYCHQRVQCARCHKDRGVKPATARVHRKRNRLRGRG